MPVKEKLVKILAPGVGWIEMAAQNRRRNDTSRHAVGVWEEFSFLDKGSLFSLGEMVGGNTGGFSWGNLGAELASAGCVFPFENGNQIIWRSS